MKNFKVKIEVVKTNEICPKGLKEGDFFVMENVSGAEVPHGMCARAFHAVYPVTMAMRFSDEISWEQGKGYFDVTCPDGYMVYRLSRIK